MNLSKIIIPNIFSIFEFAFFFQCSVFSIKAIFPVLFPIFKFKFTFQLSILKVKLTFTVSFPLVKFTLLFQSTKQPISTILFIFFPINKKLLPPLFISNLDTFSMFPSFFPFRVLNIMIFLFFSNPAMINSAFPFCLNPPVLVFEHSSSIWFSVFSFSMIHAFYAIIVILNLPFVTFLNSKKLFSPFFNPIFEFLHFLTKFILFSLPSNKFLNI